MYGPLIELGSAVRETWFGPFDFAEFRNLANELVDLHAGMYA